MAEVVEARVPKAAYDGVLRGWRCRLAELERWRDDSVKDVAQQAVREEMARVGREMVEHEWRWA